VVELNDQGHGFGLDELGDDLGLVLAIEFGLLLIKVLEKYDLVSGDTVLGGDSVVRGDAKLDVVHVGSGLEESLGGLALLVLEEADNGNLVIFEELLGGIDVSEGSSWWAGLLLQPRDDGVGGAATAVLGGLAIAEELQGGVTTHLKLLGELALLGGVNLSESDVASLLFQSLGSLGVLGSEGLAVSAPRGVKLDQDELVVLDGVFKVSLCQDQDSFVLGDLGCGRGHAQKGQQESLHFCVKNKFHQTFYKIPKKPKSFS